MITIKEEIQIMEKFLSIIESRNDFRCYTDASGYLFRYGDAAAKFCILQSRVSDRKVFEYTTRLPDQHKPFIFSHSIKKVSYISTLFSKEKRKHYKLFSKIDNIVIQAYEKELVRMASEKEDIQKSNTKKFLDLDIT